MKVRKLEKAEHIKTRKLWEEIFTEDTPEFLDYYYSVKAEENEIYIVEKGGHICAMLHLNPYTMKIAGESFSTHYIVAVATEEKYRHQGMMRALLRKALSDLKDNGEPFTFLMPAAEQIYYPHGFRYIYKQQQGEIYKTVRKKEEWEIFYATKKDCEEIVAFVNGILENRYEVYAKRDRKYYEMLLKEQKSEQGGILILRENQKIIGVFPYAVGEECEIREPLFVGESKEVLPYISAYISGEKKIKVLGYGDTEKPMIMAKILDVEKMFSCIKTTEEMYLKVEICDTLTNESVGCFLLDGREKIEVKKIEEVKECVRMDVGDLTAILFGTADMEKLELSSQVKEELSKIIPLTKIYLNEVV
ncbi:hypothetical protein JCM31739_20980 [Faecalimonas canis]